MSSVLPVVHGILLHGYEFAIYSTALKYLLVMACCYLVGGYTYVSRVPEKYWPGRFDYWLNSHQILHMMVIMGSLINWQGAVQSYHFWHLAVPGSVCKIDPTEHLRMWLNQ